MSVLITAAWIILCVWFVAAVLLLGFGMYVAREREKRYLEWRERWK